MKDKLIMLVETFLIALFTALLIQFVFIISHHHTEEESSKESIIVSEVTSNGSN